MATATDVVNYLKSRHPYYGKVQLQKLVYYTQAWSLAWDGRPLFQDNVEAWRAGPCTWAVHHASLEREVTDEQAVSALTAEERATVDAVYDYYGDYTGNALSDRTHAEAPWLEARGDLPPSANSNNVISHRLMRRFFSQQAATGNAPQRGSTFADADSETVERAAAVQQDRWKEALALLAQ